MNLDEHKKGDDHLRILLTSVGRRSYLVKYFQEALKNNGEVYVSNSSPLSPAFITTKKSVVTPLIHDNSYIPFLLAYCKDNKIDVLIPLFDIDLPVLAAHKHEFIDIGVDVIVSSERVINTCNDKWETYLFCQKNGLHTPKTFLTIESAFQAIAKGNLRFPVIIKPRWGMGSIGIFEANDNSELEILYKLVKDRIIRTYLKNQSFGDQDLIVIIQEKLNGVEYGLDIINDLQGNYQNAIIKQKHAMRAGETDCAETVVNDNLSQFATKIGQTLQHVANLDVDVFLVGDTPHLLEMNARFGGGYPFSHVAGANLPLAIINWIRGEQVGKELLSVKPGVLAHKDINLVILTPDETFNNGGAL
ncbi:MAG: ATP-grasp domain-containing protein [Eubacteriales bacterium]